MTPSNTVQANATIEAYRPEDITYLTDQERLVFLIVFGILLIVSFLGNVAAILVTMRRNHRFVQKTCIISLSLSDLIMTAAYCTNNMETFSHPCVNWTLEEFLCSFIPMVQIFGLVVNLASMVVIAMDRYVNVVKALSHRWNPTPCNCILGFVFIWLVCAGISYPIYPMFAIKIARVYHKLPQDVYVKYEFCFTTVKDQLKEYYISIAVLVFSTLWGCLLFLNCSIAHLVWSHRKPVMGAGVHLEQSIYSVETSSTHLSGAVPPPPPCDTSAIARRQKIQIQTRGRRAHVARRLRTFKIIVFSMLIFTACRLPFWVFNIMKLSCMDTEKHHWLMLYSFNALALLNCAINPFLYTFLHPTLRTLCKLGHFTQDFVRKICCCYCTATEFDEFGKDNPFCTDMKGKQPR